MAEEVVTQAATQAAEAAEQVIHQTVETAATQSYVGLFGTFNWLVDTTAPWLMLALLVVFAIGWYVERQNMQDMQMQNGARGGDRESYRKRKKVSARSIVQGMSEEERKAKLSSEKSPRSQKYL